MAYVLLAAAIAAELLGTSLLKATDGFSRPLPTLATLLAYALSFALLAQAVKHIPVGVAYAIWSGLGTAAIVAIGAVFLDEPIDGFKLLGVSLVIVGVVVLYAGPSS